MEKQLSTVNPYLLSNLSASKSLKTEKKPQLFRKILIANRGEIALRIIRACKELGIQTVAVYSQPDESSLHVKLADEAICIGPAHSQKSYLQINSILAAAELSQAEAIHPGYGFLSENADFARLCHECGFKFIGPSHQNIIDMGEKTRARQLAFQAQIPLLPGTIGAVPNLECALQEADKIGYPVILKAAAGGGGRGIHIAWDALSLKNAFEKARLEAFACFGNHDMYLEKYCENPRHIEIQVLCDQHGNRISLAERDCTIQRRHQKLIEEAPSPIIDEDLRLKMSQAALKLCQFVNYQNVGTVEFLVDNTTKQFYFMEMNTRIQVEHPVTEFITGIDLIKQQIFVAAGHKLGITQKQIQIHSHSIECRINAEDPVRFTPSPGRIEGLHFPSGPGVRVDSFIYNHYRVLPFYDSMIAKIIVHAANREQAINKMLLALKECRIEGIKTNIAFHQKILSHPRFQANDYDTRFLEQNFS
jgi:acetyl-CoA carboxylase biotin carboxylase subunit